jgi:hypothetical protein
MSTPINNGGPAFPFHDEGQADPLQREHHSGMSVRTYIATAAMAALLSREDTIANGAEELMHRELARLAYQQADAMIAAGEAK